MGMIKQSSMGLVVALANLYIRAAGKASHVCEDGFLMRIRLIKNDIGEDAEG